MKSFLKEYWRWIVVPFVLVIGGVTLVWFALGADDGASPFIYNTLR